MRRTILRLARLARPVALAALSLAGFPATAPAHEIPTRVTVLAFVKTEPGRLRLLVRLPLDAVRDVEFPQRGLGYLDLSRARPYADEAARLWVAGSVTAYEDGTPLASPAIVATRLSLPSDRAFGSWSTAFATVRGAPLDTAIEVPWAQAALDVLLEYPIRSVESRFALDARFAHLGQQTTTVLRYITARGVERAYQYRGDPGLVRLDPAWYHAALQFTRLGIGHILGGIDHLLFVLCLVLPFRRARQLVVVVTAFTVAHSITLISAAMGVVPGALWFPPLVETLIAASILYMALENIVGARLDRRWAVAFGFGLVHGFGFSFALAQSLQFAGSHLALSLVAFNVGVEIGQLAVVALAVPLVSLLFRRVVAERTGIILVSAFVAHTAWHWMTARGASLGEYEYSLPDWNLAVAASALRGALVLVIIAAAGWGVLALSRRLGGASALLAGRPAPVPETGAEAGD